MTHTDNKDTSERSQLLSIIFGAGLRHNLFDPITLREEEKIKRKAEEQRQLKAMEEMRGTYR